MCVNHCRKSIRDLAVPIRCLQRKERSLLALESQFSVADSFSTPEPFHFGDVNISFIMIKYNLHYLTINANVEQQ